MYFITFSGVSPSYLSMFIGYFSFHSSVCSTHFSILSGAPYSISFSMASFASATIGISTTIFFEIEAESISICTIFASFANSLIFPVILSLNLVPMEIRRSHSLTAWFAA